ncbi:SLC13 family permease [Haladaptatus salinisoli]|uniref:SLC13 family permease n=1 Tax=Haladaptatus salinisoli TaxID=2884876 RepID=UPI001D0ADF6C|nr:SLC13 family permease [Haladaptatus salinisoli]
MAVAVLLYAPVSGDTAAMVAITVFCVSLWIGSPVKPWFTGLVCIGLIGVTFSTEVALVGFRSPATWLIVLGILIGEATRTSGLANLIERWTLRRMPAARFENTIAAYRYLLVTLSFASLLLAVLIPSSVVRVLILGPILISIGELFEERRAKVGIFLGPLFATFYGSSGVLTGSLANIIITGIVEANAGVTISWTEWLLWMGPIMGVGRTVAIIAVAYFLYRPHNSRSIVRPAESEDAFEISSDERRMLGFLLLGVAVWATDSFHGLHPLYGALLVALLTFAPRIGVVGSETLAEADFSIIFFLGAIFAIAEGLQRTAFTDLAAKAILSNLSGDASLVVVLTVVSIASVILVFLMEGLAAASVLTPILTSFTSGAGVPLLPVAMVEAVVLNSYFFPYQSAVLIAILGLDMADSGEVIRVAALGSILTFGILLPIQAVAFALVF